MKILETIDIPRGEAGTRATLYRIARVAVEGWATQRDFLMGFPAAPRELDLRFRALWLYVPDPPTATDAIRTIEEMRRSFLATGRIEGDCDDAATLATAVAMAHRLPVEIVAIRPPHSIRFEHVFVVIQGVRIDPTAAIAADYRSCEKLTFKF